MQKMINFDFLMGVDPWKPFLPGGHLIEIKLAEPKLTKDGRESMIVTFDTTAEDDQPHYFTTEYDRDIRPDKKYPYQGTKWIVIEEAPGGNATKAFGNFIRFLQQSNTAFKIKWIDGDAFYQQFVGLKIGGVFGLVENEYQGKRNQRAELRWFCKYNEAKKMPVPKPKLLSGTSPTTSNNAVVQTIDPIVFDNEDDELELPIR